MEAEQVVREQNSKWKPSSFMTYYSDAEIGANESIFPEQIFLEWLSQEASLGILGERQQTWTSNHDDQPLGLVRDCVSAMPSTGIASGWDNKHGRS